MNILQRAKHSLYARTYTLLHKKEPVSVKELFRSEQMTKSHHPLCALRYLAIENHYGENADGFAFYSGANRKRLSDEQVERGKKRFEDLIQSFEQNGYNGSPVIMDTYGNIFNGTHRLALCAYRRVETISVCKGFREEPEDTAAKMMDRLGLDDAGRRRLEETYERMRARLYEQDRSQ